MIFIVVNYLLFHMIVFAFKYNKYDIATFYMATEYLRGGGDI